MVPQDSRPRSVGIAVIIAALALAVIYVATLRHLALDTPSIDASSMQSQLDEMRARRGDPIEPLPTIPMYDPTSLDMARDPFEPLEF